MVLVMHKILGMLAPIFSQYWGGQEERMHDYTLDYRPVHLIVLCGKVYYNVGISEK